MQRPLIALVGVLAAIALVPSQAGAATLIGDYRFDDNLASSVGTPPALMPLLPSGTFSTATVDNAPDRVYDFVADSGLRLPLAALPNPTTYSTVITFEFDVVSGYKRILSFDTFDADSDSGFYTLDGSLVFYGDPGDETAGASLAENTYADVAFTRAASGQIAAYTNGAPQFTYPDSNGESIVGIDGLRFFKDDGATETSAGSVARVRVYDGALTPAEVLDIEQTGGLRSTASVAGKPTAGPKKKKPKSVSTGISLACPAEGVPCAISAAVTTVKKGKKKTIGTLAGELPAGASVVPGVALSKKGRKLLAKKGKQKIAIESSVTAGSGTPATATNKGKV